MTTDRIVAWRVTARGTFHGAGIYAAATVARAKALAFDAIWDVGYMVAWDDMAAERAPEFDGWIAGLGQERGWDEEYARRCMAEDDARIAQDAPGRADGGLT
jgi:hypothetical protein